MISILFFKLFFLQEKIGFKQTLLRVVVNYLEFQLRLNIVHLLCSLEFCFDFNRRNCGLKLKDFIIGGEKLIP